MQNAYALCYFCACSAFFSLFKVPKFNNYYRKYVPIEILGKRVYNIFTLNIFKGEAL